jgi:hypothetical protein
MKKLLEKNKWFVCKEKIMVHRKEKYKHGKKALEMFTIPAHETLVELLVIAFFPAHELQAILVTISVRFTAPTCHT